MTQTKHGCRFGRDHGVTLADGVGKQTDVSPCNSPRTFQITGRNPRHAAGVLCRWNIETNAVLLHDLGKCSTDIWLMIIGVVIDEIHDL